MTSYERFQNDQSFRYKVIGRLADMGYIFHGSDKSFDSFDSSKIKGGFRGREGYGAYFTNEAYKAEEYGSNFVILSTKGLNIVNSNTTFEELRILTPYEVEQRIKQLEYQLDNVRSNSEYNTIDNETKKLKSYLNDKLLNGISNEDYKILKQYDFAPLASKNTIHKALSFAYSKLSSSGMQSMSKILQNVGIDGYIIDNVYVIINFEKLNNNIVKDKESLINSVINRNEMKKVVSLKRKDINEMVESIISKILKESYNEKENVTLKEDVHSMADGGDETSILLKQISQKCDFGREMLSKQNVTSADGAFIEIQELAHELYTQIKNNEITYGV